MKISLISKYLLPVFVLPVLLLTGCFSPYKGDTATLRLLLGSGALSRDISDTLPDVPVEKQLVHNIGLSGPTGKISMNVPAGQSSVQVEVAPGRWDITVEALLDGEPYANGSASADIKAGQNNPVQITMYLVKKLPPLTGAIGMDGNNWIGEENSLYATFEYPRNPDTGGTGGETEVPVINYEWRRGNTVVQVDTGIASGDPSVYDIKDTDWNQDITVTATCVGYSGSISDSRRIYKAINTVDDFMNIGLNSETLAGSYILLTDLTSNNGGAPSVPIGTAIAPFTGTFEGNYGTIEFSCSPSIYSDPYLGLFESIGSRGMVKNLKLSGSIYIYPDSTLTVGGVAGINNGTIQDISSTLSINANSTMTNTSVIAGGIAGTNNGTIQNCSVSSYASLMVSADNEADAGGIAGSNSGTIQNCYITCNVSAGTTGTGTTVTAGGIVGMMNGGSINYCWAGWYGNISGYSSGDDNPLITGVGGIAGYVNGTIGSCAALTGYISSSSGFIGRIWGQAGDNLKASNNYGNTNMSVPNSPSVTWNNDPAGKDGADVDGSAYSDSNWWINTVGWGAVWGYDDTQPWMWNPDQNSDTPTSNMPILYFE